MLMPLTVAPAVLPATSVAEPVADWLAPSPDSVCGPGHAATPDGVSLQTKDTVTAELFHPLPLAPGVREPAMLGGVRSVLMVTDPLPVPPSLVAVQLVAVVPELVIDMGSHPVLEPMADSSSWMSQVSETFDRYQPAFPAVPVISGCRRR